jgi:hypothetical protein
MMKYFQSANNFVRTKTHLVLRKKQADFKSLIILYRYTHIQMRKYMIQCV